jgi:hypothetical protein
MKKDRHYSKRQLEKNMRKMGEIIMIGAIASIEDKFGFLWGKNKQCGFTEDEEEAYELWEALRTEILDKGNKNIEKAVQMLNVFTVYMEKDNFYFELKNKKRES